MMAAAVEHSKAHVKRCQDLAEVAREELMLLRARLEIVALNYDEATLLRLVRALKGLNGAASAPADTKPE